MNYVFTIFAVILTAVLTTFFEYYFNIKRDRQNKKNRLLILLASIKTELFIIKNKTIFNYYNYIKEERKKLLRLVDRVI